MKRKIENILKKNLILNKLYTLLGSLIVKTLGVFVKKDSKTILFVSYMGKNFNDSPKIIYDKMLQDSDFKDYTFIWAFNDVNKFKIQNKNTKVVKMDSLEYLLIALKAEYWITNVNIERGLHFKKKYTKYINTWHGIPFKKVGNDVSGRSDFNFSDTDVFCYSGDYEYNIYKRAFNLDSQNLYKIGMPRNDLIIKNDQSIKEAIRTKYDIKDKKIILYAPTWRENEDDLEIIDFNHWKKHLSNDYIVFIKSHGLSRKFDVQHNDFVVDVSDYEETSELIVASDILITDYSSIMFDFALLHKPIFIYATDYKKYTKERGVYFDLEETGLKIFKEPDVLLKHIKQYNEEVESKHSKEFGGKFNQIQRPNSTNQIIALIKEGEI